jgi:HTH-type transcriptional regulator / antitoxin MqsA
MSDSRSNGRGGICPICGRGILRPRLISEVFDYGDEGDSVLVRTHDVPIEDCYSCGESFSGPKAARIRHEAIGQALGLLPPQEIRAIRERLALSPEDFAKLIGVGADLLAQWEDGSVWQGRTADRLIRLLGQRKENLPDLETLIAASPMEVVDPETQRRSEPEKRPGRRIVIGDSGI